MKGERLKVKGERLKVKGLFLFVFLSIFNFQFSTCLAQPRLRTPVYYIGAHGGATAGTVAFRPAQDDMTPITNACVLGGNGGLVFRYEGHKYCAFQMEMNYEHRGWKQAGISHNLHYVEVPILMHLNFGGETCKWFFNLGPQIGYCVKDESNAIDHRFDWGAAAGTGLYFKTKKAGVYQLEIRYDFSFGAVYGTSLTDKYEMANPMDLSINLGWLFPIQKKQIKHKHNENEL